MNPLILAAGVSAAGNAVSAGANGLFGLLGQNKQHRYNMEETEHNLGLQYKYNSQGASEAYRRQVDFYKNFMSYAAQKRQMREAGLNPALMYGMGGAAGSGSTNTHAASVSGGVGGTGMPTLGMGNLGSDIADAILKKAEAEKAQAEADNLRGKDGTKGHWEVKKLIEETKVLTQQAIMGEVDARWRNIMNQTQTNLMQSQIDAAFNNYQLNMTKLSLEAERITLEKNKFEEGKRQFGMSYKLEERKSQAQEQQFYDKLGQEESQFKRNLENAINSQARDMKFKNEQQEKQFKHDLKMTMWKTAGNVIGGGLGGMLLKLL